MKEANAKPRRTGKGRQVRSKIKTARKRPPAVRSEAFSEAVADAQSYIKNPERLRVLLIEAARKVASIPREPFKESWAYLQAMLRLVRAYYRGEYRDVPLAALISIIAALAYVANPFDLIPDVVPFLGFVDDAAVIAFALSKTKQALDEFMVWETSKV